MRTKTGKCFIALLLAAMLLLSAACSSGSKKDSRKYYADSAYVPVGVEGLTSVSRYTPDTLPEGENPMDKIVLKAGNSEISNGLLQIVFMNQYYSFIGQNSSYLSYFNFSTELPMYEQASMTDGMTWEQYFVNITIDILHQYAAKAAEADATGFVLPADVQEVIDKTPETLKEQAEANGYDSALDFVKESYADISLQDYYDFVRLYYYSGYFGNQMSDAITVSDDDARAYYEEHADEMATYGYVKTDLNDVNIRHILITPSDSDGDGVTSGEDKAAALEKAKEVYALYLQNPTEEHFAELAAEYSAASNGTEGGLYENVYDGELTGGVQSWSFSADRKPGDTGIVETEAGYHIMYFVGACSTMTWLESCREARKTEILNGQITALTEKYPMTAAYSGIVLQNPPAALE